MGLPQCAVILRRYSSLPVRLAGLADPSDPGDSGTELDDIELWFKIVTGLI